MAKKYVYFFGAGAAEGNMKMKDVLGGKGANLAEMAGIGLPVPPGFTISTEVCALYYKSRQRVPEAVRLEVEKLVNAGLTALVIVVGIAAGIALILVAAHGIAEGMDDMTWTSCPFVYSYDGNGNLTWLQPSMTAAGVNLYAYDGFDRLATRTWASGSGDRSVSRAQPSGSRARPS